MNKSNPELYITLGLPSSGKTYFSKQLASDLGIFFLNTDLLRLDMIDQPTFSPDEHALVYRTMGHVAKKHIEQGLSIVCNGNYNQYARRETMRQMAAKYSAVCLAVWVDTPEELLIQRIQTRNHEIAPEKMVHQPLELLERMQRAFESPTADELVIRIDGTLPYEKQYHSFLTQKQKLLVA